MVYTFCKKSNRFRIFPFKCLTNAFQLYFIVWFWYVTSKCDRTSWCRVYRTQNWMNRAMEMEKFRLLAKAINEMTMPMNWILPMLKLYLFWIDRYSERRARRDRNGEETISETETDNNKMGSTNCEKYIVKTGKDSNATRVKCLTHYVIWFIFFNKANDCHCESEKREANNFTK